MIVRFRKYKTNRKELEIKTSIIRVLKIGEEVEIEFKGRPSQTELQEIAKRLGLPYIEIEPKNSKLRERKELSALIESSKVVARRGIYDRAG